MASLDKIKVAVRVRPFNKREIAMGTAQSVVRMLGNQTLLHHPDGEDLNKIPKTFTFDNCFDSLDAGSPGFADQSCVFSAVGEDILDNAFRVGRHGNQMIKSLPDSTLVFSGIQCVYFCLRPDGLR